LLIDRAGTGACPYDDFDDAMNMVWHDDKLADVKSIVINGNSISVSDLSVGFVKNMRQPTPAVTGSKTV
jgi:hypothetical protein